MASNLLSAIRVQNAAPKDQPYRLHDGEGLALRVAPSGVKSWQLRYRLHGKPQTATLGKLSVLSLAEAREKAGALRKAAATGEHLTQRKRLAKMKKRADAANTFAVMAAGWVKREARRQEWTPDYTEEVRASLRNHLANLDALPVASLDAPMLAPVLRAIEDRAPLMLEKVRRRLNVILDYAVEHGAIRGNPLPAARRGKKKERRHFPAVVNLPGVGAILRAARTSDPCKGVQRAHLLLVFTALRVSEVVGARWEEFDLDGAPVASANGRRVRLDQAAGNWTVPRERMKRKDTERGPHIVPLPPALLAALRQWRADDGPGAEYVCPAPRTATRPITAEAVEKHYRDVLTLGGKHSPHSWRSAFSTICRDAGKDGATVEAQLDHVVGNAVQAAYDRAARIELRRELLRWYESTLIVSRDGATVVALHASAS